MPSDDSRWGEDPRWGSGGSRWGQEAPAEPQGPVVPEWFAAAIAKEPSSHRITVADCAIHYLRWGPEAAERPGILFVHGGSAHAHWWSFIAPYFCGDRPVAALDLSGMGDSGHRPEYSGELHAAELAAVIADAKLGPKPIVVGHSFGGYVTLAFAERHREEISAAVIVDSPVRRPEELGGGPRRPFPRPPAMFPNFETLVRRFRMVPSQTVAEEYVTDFIARHSGIQTPQGWTWKYDAEASGKRRVDEPLHEYLARMPCPTALIHGSESVLVTPEVVDYMTGLMGPQGVAVCIPDCHHHVMADRPHAFIAALRAILAGWQAAGRL